MLPQISLFILMPLCCITASISAMQQLNKFNVYKAKAFCDKKPLKIKQPKTSPFKTTQKKSTFVPNRLVSDIIYAKALAYTAIFITLKVIMSYLEEIINFDIRYMTRDMKSIDYCDYGYYILSEALNDINNALQVFQDTTLTWCSLSVCMYKIYTVIQHISTPIILNGKERQIVARYAQEGSNNHVCLNTATTLYTKQEAHAVFKQLIGVNRKLLYAIVDYFNGCNRYPKNKQSLIVAYKEHFPSIDIADIYLKNILFTNTKIKNPILNLYQTFKSSYLEQNDYWIKNLSHKNNL